MEYKIKEIIQSNKNKIKIFNTYINFYNKKRMKQIMPVRIYRIAGEVGNKKGIQIGIVNTLNGQMLPVYRENSYNKLTEKIVGYIPVDKNTYLAVVKSVLIKRIAVILSLLSIICCLIIAINYQNRFI